jgi:crossover junction endodeoxyribonuclease RusA
VARWHILTPSRGREPGCDARYAVGDTAAVTVTHLGPGGRLPLEFTVPGIPVSGQTASRRIKEGWKRAVTERAAVAWGRAEPRTDDLALVVAMFASGGWRLDLDNMAKPILDAMTGLVWVDDRQLVDVHLVRKSFDQPVLLQGVTQVLGNALAEPGPFVYLRVAEATDFRVLP